MSNLKPLRLYDNSRLSDYRRCPRYFLYRHVYDWAPVQKSVALIFGSSWHEAMDVVWAHAKDDPKENNKIVAEAHYAFTAKWTEMGMQHPDEMGPDEIELLGARTPMIAQEMLYHYIDERQHIFKDKSFELVDIETPFAVPLDPNDSSLFYVGRLDKVFKYRRQYYVGEHKTSTSYKKGGPFRNDFLDSFSPNSQVDGYLYAMRLKYKDEAAAVWVDAALVHKSEHDGFKLIPVDRQFAQIDAWLYETHFWIDQVEGNLEVLKERSELDTPYLAAFPKNTGSCGNYGGCAYADICRAVANPAKLTEPPLGYKVEHWSPFDEIKLERIGFTRDRVEEVTNG